MKKEKKKDINNTDIKSEIKDGVEIFHCDECNFESKYRGSIKEHKKMHMNPEDLKFYHCPDCDFKSKHKSNLSQVSCSFSSKLFTERGSVACRNS